MAVRHSPGPCSGAEPRRAGAASPRAAAGGIHGSAVDALPLPRAVPRPVRRVRARARRVRALDQPAQLGLPAARQALRRAGQLHRPVRQLVGAVRALLARHAGDRHLHASSACRSSSCCRCCSRSCSTAGSRAAPSSGPSSSPRTCSAWPSSACCGRYLLDPSFGAGQRAARGGRPARRHRLDHRPAVGVDLAGRRSPSGGRSGFNAVIYLAGLGDIPRRALRGRRARRGLVVAAAPLHHAPRPAAGAGLRVITTILASANMFGQSYLITQGAPGDTTRTAIIESSPTSACRSTAWGRRPP